MTIKQPPQWAIKQHIEKNPKCEWLCIHTSNYNLGEEKPDDCTCPNNPDKLINERCSIHGGTKQ